MADPKLDPEIVDDLAEFLKNKSSNNKKVVAKDAIKKALTLLSSSDCGIQKGGAGVLDKCLAGVGASMIAETVYLLSKGDYDPHKVANKILTKVMITLAAHSCSVISKKCKLTYKRLTNVPENTENESIPREAASIAVPNEMEAMREEMKAMREEMKAMRKELSNTRRAPRGRNNNNKSAKKND